jgi:hypothetical protein
MGLVYKGMDPFLTLGWGEELKKELEAKIKRESGWEFKPKEIRA